MTLSYKHAIGLSVLAVAVIGYVFVQNTKHTENYGFICPDAFTSGEDYLASIGQWVTTYKESYPDATEDEMIAARAELGEKMECGPSPFGVDPAIRSPEDMDEIDPKTEAIMDAIKKVEADKPPGISENPTEEEVYTNPYILHIRTALKGYLDGSNNGVEAGVTEVDTKSDCGLDAYDKSYYKSKFIVLGASVNPYGGVNADILFVDKPDTFYWAWVYQYGGGEYILRSFCKAGPKEGTEEEFAKMMKRVLPTVDHAL
ncbi:hypothetical protein EXS57_03640 [Candidatus Kaiserbacteria bacterium]|nr:hypothetical protein [Candidatus Kaiserbacteria bacterium]